MLKRQLIAGFVVLVAACGVASGHAAKSGIAGRVLAAPTCPAETVPPQPECAPKPLAVNLHVRRVGSTDVSRIRSGTDGRFRIHLSAGTYIVRALRHDGSPFPRPPAASRVRVHSDRLTRIIITYDTGIR
jgi:hypothetical protein